MSELTFLSVSAILDDWSRQRQQWDAYVQSVQTQWRRVAWHAGAVFAASFAAGYLAVRR